MGHAGWYVKTLARVEHMRGTVHLQRQRTLEDIEKLTRHRVIMPDLGAIRRHALLDDGKVGPFEKRPSFTVPLPEIAGRYIAIDDH